MTQSLPPSETPSSSLPVRVSSGYVGRPRGSGPNLGAMESEAPPLDLQRVLGVLYRYKWLVALTTLAGLGAAIGATRFIKPRYIAQATVWIQENNRRDPNGPIQSGNLVEWTAWADLLKSYVVLDDVVRRLHLYITPTSPADTTAFASFDLAERFLPGDYRLDFSQQGDSFHLTRKDGGVDQSGRIGDSIGTAIGFGWAPTAEQLAGTGSMEFFVMAPRDAALTLGQGIQTHLDPQATFLSVELEGQDATRIANTVNALVDRLVDVAAQLKREKLTELTRILDGQLRYAAQNLHNAETELENFKVQTITLPNDRAPVSPGLIETRDPVMSNFFNMNVEKEQIRVDREALERALAQIRDSGVVSTDAFNTIGAVQRSADLAAALKELTDKQAELRALQLRYTDQAPPLRRLAEAVDSLSRRTIPALGNQLLAQLRSRETDLEGRVGSTARDLQKIPPRAIEEARLQRQADIDADLYTRVQQRYEEARLAETTSIPDIRVLDRAAKPERVLHNTLLGLLLLGLVGGMGAGVGGAILLDRFDQRVRHPDQVTREMGLTILGAVPHVGTGKLAEADTNQVMEAVRGLRLSVANAYGAAGPLVLTITSPGPGDGKSFISSNLALSFSDNGHRTLLVDGDARRGRLQELFKVARKPGLTDFLMGQAKMEQLVHTTSFNGLSLIPCGTRTSEAPELLGSPAMQQLMAGLKSSYDVIIVDSPPLGAGVDPYVLSTLTGHALIVLRTGVSNRAFAEAKLDMLERLPVRILGAVLNDVKKNQGYSYYQYYAYLPGYEAKDEATAGAGGRKSGRKTLPGVGKAS
jgi:capsular exopolysaccharide synthesis family protein